MPVLGTLKDYRIISITFSENPAKQNWEVLSIFSLCTFNHYLHKFLIILAQVTLISEFLLLPELSDTDAQDSHGPISLSPSHALPCPALPCPASL